MPRPLLHLDGAAGISGDMTLGALVDLGVPVVALREGLGSLRLPDWSLDALPVVKGGLRATKVRVVVHGQVELPHDAGHGHGHDHDHDAGHDHHHGHDHAHPTPAPASHHHPEGHGRSWPEIRDRIAGSALPARARDAALAVFRRLCEVEAEIHGVALDDVHLHEVGADDALVDICGCCLALDILGWPEISAAPPDLGGGSVGSSHGRLPVPSPATLRLLEGKPVTSSGLPKELTTPTGAALLAVLVTRWGGLPPMTVRRSGFGAGTRDLADRPNVLRATLGDAPEDAPAPGATHVVLEADLDDADPQLLAAFADRAREIGALDVALAPVTMKKGRPGTRVSVLGAASARDLLLEALFRETTTIGCRILRVERAECDREIRDVATPYGPVRVKLARWNGRPVNAKPEHDDCLAAARRAGVPLKDVVAAAAAAARTLLEPSP